MMIEAYATGFPIRISPYGSSAAAAGNGTVVGFTRPWAHSGDQAPPGPVSPGSGSAWPGHRAAGLRERSH